MGFGDKLMAIGDAWALHQADEQRRRVAIGDGKIIDTTDLDLTWGLANFLVPPEEVGQEDHLWAYSRPGRRPYHDYAEMKRLCHNMGRDLDKTSKMLQTLGHYIFNMDYRATPAPIRLTPEEQAITDEWSKRGPFVLIEPYIKRDAPPSKQWPVERFFTVAKRLSKEMPVYQLSGPDRAALPGLEKIQARNFRGVMAYLKASALYIGPEGGLHHAAAAMGTPAVVIFGGFTPPLLTGYDFHVNLTGDNGNRYCGTRWGMCPHCKTALHSISVDAVHMHARQLLGLKR